jgi:hypothetical protein
LKLALKAKWPQPRGDAGVTGYEGKKSREVGPHLRLDAVEQADQEAVPSSGR